MDTVLLANNATCTTIHGAYCSGWQEMTSLDIIFVTIALPPNVARWVCLPATQQLEANVTHHHHQQPNAASQRESEPREHANNADIRVIKARLRHSTVLTTVVVCWNTLP